MPEAIPPRPNLTLGIVTGATADVAQYCVVDHERQLVTWGALRSSGRPIRQVEAERGKVEDGVQSGDLGTFLDTVEGTMPPNAEVGLFLEADRILPFPDEGDTPAGIFSWSSATFAAALAFLRTQRLGVPLVLAFYEVAERSAMVVHHVVQDSAGRLPERAVQPHLLSTGLLNACTQGVTGGVVTPRARSLVGALLARCPGAYSYWSSFGQPPSSGDVVDHLRRGQQRMLVGTPSEMISMRIRPGEWSAAELLADYALSEQTLGDLSANDRAKAALVCICRSYGFDLSCVSTRPDIHARDPRRVWPWPEQDRWALDRSDLSVDVG